MSDQATQARQALRHVLQFARTWTYTTNGNAWRQFVASLAFETKADLSLVRDFEEADQHRFNLIVTAFMVGELTADEITDHYLEYFPRPAPDLDSHGWFLGG